jgi:hypothetical protein
VNGLARLNFNDFQVLGLVVAFVGYLMVAFAFEYSIPALDNLVGNRLWFNGFFGLSLIIIGMMMVVVHKR